MTASVSDIGAEAVTEMELPDEYVGRNVWGDIGQMFRLILGHIKSDPVWGTVLWAYVIGASTFSSWLGMQFMLRSADTTNALVAGKYDAVVTALIATTLALAAMVVVGFVGTFMTFTLRIRIRTFVANLLMNGWLRKKKLYSPDLGPVIDHPEQRVQEDSFTFATLVVDMLPMITGSITSFFLYSGALWALETPFTLPVPGGSHVAVPHALYLAALVSAGVLTVLAHLAGRALTRFEVVRQRLEAGFRHDLGQAREFSEQIALSRGEQIERQRAGRNYQLIQKNWTPYTTANAFLSAIQGISGNFPMVLPIALLFPLVLKGSMQVGDLQVAGESFQSLYYVIGSLISLYTSFALLRSATLRIRLMETTLAKDAPPGIVRSASAGRSFSARDLTVRTPAGEVLVAVANLEISGGQKWLIKGRSGTGKSTLFRALAGIWPFGSGTIREPENEKGVMFLPQTPYLPNGSLAELLSYPNSPEAYDADRFRKVLRDVRLERLVGEVNTIRPWSKILSPGEQQRLCLGRALLQRPDLLFLDEATSSLDAQTELEVFAALSDQLRDSAIVAISHNEQVTQAKDFVLMVERGHGSISDLRSAPATNVPKDGPHV